MGIFLKKINDQSINITYVKHPSSIKQVKFNDIVKDCDAVLHLAALIAIPYSYKAPQSYIDTNILGTLNLLQASVRNNIRRFIQTSTSEVYGTAKFVPITEDHPLSGQSPYAASKIGSDQLAYSFFASFGLPVVILRPFNTYGPRQSARAVKLYRMRSLVMLLKSYKQTPQCNPALKRIGKR